jgi:hypothetical protein
VLVLLLLLAPLTLGEVDAARRLAEIQQQFPLRSRAQSIADARRLADEAPGTEAAGRALLFLGGLALEAGAHGEASGWYERARGAHVAVRALAERGLGDVAFAERRYGEAMHRYDAAIGDAAPPLRDELRFKRAAAGRMRRGWLGEWAAWLAAAGALLVMWWRRDPGAPRVPREVVFVGPVYAIVIAAALGRDPRALPALVGIAAGSLALLWAWGRVPRPGAARALLGPCLSAQAAVIYAACHRAHLLDAILMRGL